MCDICGPNKPSHLRPYRNDAVGAIYDILSPRQFKSPPFTRRRNIADNGRLADNSDIELIIDLYQTVLDISRMLTLFLECYLKTHTGFKQNPYFTVFALSLYSTDSYNDW